MIRFQVETGHLQPTYSALRGASVFTRGRVDPGRHEKLRAFADRTRPMDIERINLIGSQLGDLSRRTEALRGYL
jgi:hypothetical protein